MISPEIRTVIKHASVLARAGDCSTPSSTFTTFAYNKLAEKSLLPADLLFADFDVCDSDYLAKLQYALNFTTAVSTDVTFSNFVVVPPALDSILTQFFGDTVFDGGLVSQSVHVVYTTDTTTHTFCSFAMYISCLILLDPSLCAVY